MIISDLARLIDTVHREKAIPREVLVEIIEQAMIAAARRKYGIEHDIEAHYHEELGEVELFEFKTVVEEIDDESGDILFDEARELDPECEVGDQLGVKMIVEDLGRIAAQTAKQVILQKIRDAEREMTFNEYRDRKGELIRSRGCHRHPPRRPDGQRQAAGREAHHYADDSVQDRLGVPAA